MVITCAYVVYKHREKPDLEKFGWATFVQDKLVLPFKTVKKGMVTFNPKDLYVKKDKRKLQIPLLKKDRSNGSQVYGAIIRAKNEQNLQCVCGSSPH